ncbi:MAG TPA: family 1 glycosylhydrolase [Fimbriimonadaceae bacterium]
MIEKAVNSEVQQLLDSNDFLWATGIEDTFIAQPWTKTGRTLDEYELTAHYDRYQEDSELIASLGVKHARYGIPWYRIQPEPNKWDWGWADDVLESLTSRGVQPILDLMHYGTPAWLTGSFADPDYPQRVADYAQAAAERYGKAIRWYTPLNEARITAYYCGRIGWWPPNLRGWPGFVSVMMGVAKGIALSQERIKKAVPNCVIAHVDACDIYSTQDPTLEAECQLRQEMVYLATDLITGRVTENHPLMPWLTKNRVSHKDLDFLQGHGQNPDIIGLNLYPMFSQKKCVRTPRGVRFRMSYASPSIINDIAHRHYERYKLPMFVSETATIGNVAKRAKWMHGSIAAVKQARQGNVPLVGYTWWPLFSLVGWGYRQLGTYPMGKYVLDMGLWDLANKEPDPLKRAETPLVEEYRRIVKGGLETVGPIGEGKTEHVQKLLHRRV